MSDQEARRRLAALGVSAHQATENLRHFAHHAGGDPYGVRTIDGAKAAYVRGEIDLDEYERRVEIFLSGRPFVLLEPGEQVVTADHPLAIQQRARRACGEPLWPTTA